MPILSPSRCCLSFFTAYFTIIIDAYLLWCWSSLQLSLLFRMLKFWSIQCDWFKIDFVEDVYYKDQYWFLSPPLHAFCYRQTMYMHPFILYWKWKKRWNTVILLYQNVINWLSQISNCFVNPETSLFHRISVLSYDFISLFCVFILLL